MSDCAVRSPCVIRPAPRGFRHFDDIGSREREPRVRLQPRSLDDLNHNASVVLAHDPICGHASERRSLDQKPIRCPKLVHNKSSRLVLPVPFLRSRRTLRRDGAGMRWIHEPLFGQVPMEPELSVPISGRLGICPAQAKLRGVPVDELEHPPELLAAGRVDRRDPGDPAADMRLEVGNRATVVGRRAVAGGVVQQRPQPVVFDARDVGVVVDDDPADRLA